MSDVLNFTKGLGKAVIKTAVIPLEAVVDTVKGRNLESTAELIEDVGSDLSDALTALFGGDDNEDGVDEV